MFYILFIKEAVGEKNKSLRKGDTNKLVQKICGKRREQAPALHLFKHRTDFCIKLLPEFEFICADIQSFPNNSKYSCIFQKR